MLPFFELVIQISILNERKLVATGKNNSHCIKSKILVTVINGSGSGGGSDNGGEFTYNVLYDLDSLKMVTFY